MTTVCASSSFVTQKGGAGKTTLAVNCAVAAEQRQETSDLRPRRPGVRRNLVPGPRGRDAPAGQGRLVETARRPGPSEVRRLRLRHDRHARPRRAGDRRRHPRRRLLHHPLPSDAGRSEGDAAYGGDRQPPGEARRLRADADAAAGRAGTRGRGGLAMLGIVCPVRIVARTAYQDAQGAGLGVPEFEPEGKAAAEIAQLWNWMYARWRR